MVLLHAACAARDAACLTGTALVLLSLSAVRTAAAVPEVGFCKPYTWLFGGWVAPPRMPLLADMNGDGYADFLYATPDAKLVDISHNGKGWKPLRGERVLSDLPDRIMAMTSGRFAGNGADLAILGVQTGMIGNTSDREHR